MTMRRWRQTIVTILSGSEKYRSASYISDAMATEDTHRTSACLQLHVATHICRYDCLFMFRLTVTSHFQYQDNDELSEVPVWVPGSTARHMGYVLKKKTDSGIDCSPTISSFNISIWWNSLKTDQQETEVSYVAGRFLLTFWCRNYFFNFSTLCI